MLCLKIKIKKGRSERIRKTEKKRSSDALKVDKRSITRRQDGFRLAERVPFYIDEARFLSEQMSALSRNDRCGWNGCRRSTTRIVDDAVLEKKLEENRKTREDVTELCTNREEKEESKEMRSLQFTIRAIRVPASSVSIFLFFFLCFSRKIDRMPNNKKGENRKEEERIER